MSIEFHCEHCDKLVKAPASAGGRRAKCPYCQGTCYVPLSPDEAEELPLAPLDEGDEAQRRRALHETAALQRELLRDQALPEDRQRGGRRSSGVVGAGRDAAAGSMSAVEIRRHVIAYVEAMSEGRLEEANRVVDRLKAEREAVSRFIESVASDQLAGSEMPALPRPVLLGFLKQLRSGL